MVEREGLDWGWKKKLRLIRQTESAECGIACLAMVADWYGFKIDLPSLRTRYNYSQHGLKLTDVIKCAQGLNLSSRALHADLHDLKKLSIPCILHWNMNHFVVLSKVTERNCEIYDPASGICKISWDEMDKCYTGVALELTPTVDFEQADLRKKVKIRDLIGKTYGFKSALSKIFVFAVTLELLALISPLINQVIIDEVLVTFDYSLLNLVIISLLLVSATQSVVNLVKSWFTVYLSENFNMQWASNIFSHLIRLPIEWFEKRELGDISAKFDSLNAIQQAITNNLIQAFLDVILVAGTLTIMFFYSPALTMISLVTVIIYTIMRFTWFDSFKKAEEDVWFTNAKEQSYFLETLHGILSVRINGGMEWREGSWKNLNILRRNAQLSESKLSMLYSVIIEWFTALSTAGVLWFGAKSVLDGGFTAGMLIAFLSFQVRFTTSTTQLINVYFDFRMLSVHTERLADIVLTEKEQLKEDMQLNTSLFNYENLPVSVDNLSFRYSENSSFLFEGLSFNVEPGEVVAITGSSGCGKTTLAKLLLGLYKPNTGSVKLFGQDVTQCNLTELRSNIGSVFQDDQLFNGSILSNICFFSPQVDLERAIECARLANIHDEIESMTMGYQTLVGEMGGTISGGQKQRIIFARALYKKPKLLILDEATSHLDVGSEKKIIEAVRHLNLPVIQIAHRPETINAADRNIHLYPSDYKKESLVA